MAHLIVLKKRRISIVIILSLVLSLFIPIFTSETASAQAVIQDLILSSEYAKPSILKLADRNVISGDENGYFNPSSFVTRAEMVAFVVKAAGYDISSVDQVPTFTDVPADHWAYPYIETAVKRGIIQGTEPGKFTPNSFCTREQASKIIINSVKNNRIALNNSADEMLLRLQRFSDFEKISDWAVDYISIAVNLGLIKGTTETTISPLDSIKREQMAVIIDRFINIYLGKILKPEFIYLTGTEQVLDFSIDLKEINNLKIRKIITTDGSEVAFTAKYYYETIEGSESTGITVYTENPEEKTKHIQVQILTSELQKGETYRVIFSFIYPMYYNPETLHFEEIIFYELPLKITESLVPRSTDITIGTTFYDARRVMNVYNYVDSDPFLYKTITFDDGSTLLGKLTDGRYLVIGWENKGSLKVNLGEKSNNTEPIEIGSSSADVVNTLGTPDIIRIELNGYSWEYSNSGKVYFNQDYVVTSW